MNATKKLHHAQLDLQFFECTHYHQLRKNVDWHDGLIECYREVFRESWGETYSYQEVVRRLKTELSGHACLRFAVDLTTNKVLAFCWAQHLSTDAIKHAVGTIHYIHTVENFSIDDAVQETNGAIYIHDIGILKSVRNTVPLALLILPVLETVSFYARSRQLLFWSIKQTCIGHIANKINIQPYYQKGDVQFFSGVLPAVYGVREFNKST